MRKTRGGGIFHPYLSSDSPNAIQTLDHKWNGSLDLVPKSANPVDYSWNWQTGTTKATSSILGQISAMPQIPYIYSRGPTPARGGRRKTRITRRNRKHRRTIRRYKSRK